MNYPNAFAGVKKLYISEVLAILTLVSALVTVFAAFFTGGLIDAGIDGAVNASLGVTGVFTILTAILSLLYFVLNLLGLSQAGKDEPIFKFALYAALLGIVVSVASGFISDGFLKDLLSVFNELTLLLVPLLSISGIQSLAQKCTDADMESRGKTLIRLITISIVVAGVAGIVYNFFANGAIVLGIISIVIDMVASLLYLGYLNRAKKMLAQ